MDLVVFENNKPWVIDEFREGRFDYIELASDVAETKFFQFLFGQQVVDRLVQHYPSPRDRHHVPLWMYVCSRLSIRLHGQHSFHSSPLIVRAGGLVDALGPEVARRRVDPDSGNLTLECAGFNDRNLYPRQTPCDQDFLRKLARDTEPEQLEEWYNRHVVTVYKGLGAFDADGLFIADGTYLFVPDNPRYEGSQRLLFDEHNHPVSKKQEQEMTKAQRARCRWPRPGVSFAEYAICSALTSCALFCAACSWSFTRQLAWLISPGPTSFCRSFRNGFRFLGKQC